MAGILIVDDNPNIRYLLRVFVETKTTFTVCGEAAHGVEAIEKAKQLHPDLILLDLSMPRCASKNDNKSTSSQSLSDQTHDLPS